MREEDKSPCIKGSTKGKCFKDTHAVKEYTKHEKNVASKPNDVVILDMDT